MSAEQTPPSGPFRLVQTCKDVFGNELEVLKKPSATGVNQFFVAKTLSAERLGLSPSALAGLQRVIQQLSLESMQRLTLREEIGGKTLHFVSEYDFKTLLQLRENFRERHEKLEESSLLALLYTLLEAGTRLQNALAFHPEFSFKSVKVALKESPANSGQIHFVFRLSNPLMNDDVVRTVGAWLEEIERAGGSLKLEESWCLDAEMRAQALLDPSLPGVEAWRRIDATIQQQARRGVYRVFWLLLEAATDSQPEQLLRTVSDKQFETELLQLVGTLGLSAPLSKILEIILLERDVEKLPTFSELQRQLKHPLEVFHAENESRTAGLDLSFLQRATNELESDLWDFFELPKNSQLFFRSRTSLHITETSSSPVQRHFTFGPSLTLPGQAVTQNDPLSALKEFSQNNTNRKETSVVTHPTLSSPAPPSSSLKASQLTEHSLPSGKVTAFAQKDLEQPTPSLPVFLSQTTQKSGKTSGPEALPLSIRSLTSQSIQPLPSVRETNTQQQSLRMGIALEVPESESKEKVSESQRKIILLDSPSQKDKSLFPSFFPDALQSRKELLSELGLPVPLFVKKLQPHQSPLNDTLGSLEREEASLRQMLGAEDQNLESPRCQQNHPGAKEKILPDLLVFPPFHPESFEGFPSSSARERGGLNSPQVLSSSSNSHKLIEALTEKPRETPTFLQRIAPPSPLNVSFATSEDSAQQLLFDRRSKENKVESLKKVSKSPASQGDHWKRDEVFLKIPSVALPDHSGMRKEDLYEKKERLMRSQEMNLSSYSGRKNDYDDFPFNTGTQPGVTQQERLTERGVSRPLSSLGRLNDSLAAKIDAFENKIKVYNVPKNFSFFDNARERPRVQECTPKKSCGRSSKAETRLKELKLSPGLVALRRCSPLSSQKKNRSHNHQRETPAMHRPFIEQRNSEINKEVIDAKLNTLRIEGALQKDRLSPTPLLRHQQPQVLDKKCFPLQTGVIFAPKDHKYEKERLQSVNFPTINSPIQANQNSFTETSYDFIRTQVPQLGGFGVPAQGSEGSSSSYTVRRFGYPLEQDTFRPQRKDKELNPNYRVVQTMPSLDSRRSTPIRPKTSVETKINRCGTDQDAFRVQQAVMNPNFPQPVTVEKTTVNTHSFSQETHFGKFYGNESFNPYAHRMEARTVDLNFNYNKF